MTDQERNEIETELVEEILQKFQAIGIDTSEWEYKFGDGNFAAEFIQAGIKDHLEKLQDQPGNDWSSAITFANNICVRISDELNNDDEVEKADIATRCAKEIRNALKQ
jgi:hypothetical protein